MKDNGFDLEILENADDADIRRIADSCPASESDKERMFAMSRKIYNERTKESNETPVIEVSGVEIYKKPFWHKFVSAAAVLAVIAGGTAGGWALLNKNKTLDASVTDNSSFTSVTENNNTTNNMEPTEKSGKDSPLIDSDYAFNEYVKVYNPILNEEHEFAVKRCHLYLESDILTYIYTQTYEMICTNVAKLAESYVSFDWKEVDPNDYINDKDILIDCSFIDLDKDYDTNYRLDFMFYDNGLVNVNFSNADDGNTIIQKSYNIGKESADRLFSSVLEEYEFVKDNISPDKMPFMFGNVLTLVEKSPKPSETYEISEDSAKNIKKILRSAEWQETEQYTTDLDKKNLNLQEPPEYTIYFASEELSTAYKMEIYSFNIVCCYFNRCEAVFEISDSIKDSIRNIIENADEELVTVPHVAGMQFELAKRLLIDSGFEVFPIMTYDNKVQPNYVISSQPAEGERMPQGSEVTLYVSKEDSAEEFTMKDYAGMNIKDATVMAGYRRLKVITEAVRSSKENDIVVAQTPPAGETVREGDEITLYYSSDTANERLMLSTIGLPDDVNGRYQLDGVLRKTDGSDTTYDFGVFLCPETKSVPIELEADDVEKMSSLSVYLLNTNNNKRALIYRVEYIRDANGNITKRNADPIDVAEVFRTVQ